MEAWYLGCFGHELQSTRHWENGALDHFFKGIPKKTMMNSRTKHFPNLK